MIIDKNYYKKVTKRILTFIISLIALYIIFKLSIFYIPFLIAVIISFIIEPVIRKVMKITKLTRKTCAIITLIFVFAVIISLLVYGIISLTTEATTILGDFNNIASNITEKITNVFSNLKIDSIKLPTQIDKLVNGTITNLIGEGTNFTQKTLTSIVEIFKNIPQILICIGITILATYFVCTDRLYIIDQMEHHLPRNLVNKVGKKIRKVTKSLGDYLKAQSILILISFVFVLVGLLGFKLFGFNVEYPFLMAIFIAFVDALPILGSGTVMIPWAVISASYGDIKLAIALIILYIIILVIRQLIEPKIVSGQIGIHPIFTLIAMYTGFKIIGILGMIIGPIVLIILKNVFENMIDNGVVKTILDRK